MKGRSTDPASEAATFFNVFAEAFDTLYDGKRNIVMRWIDRHFRSDMFARFALTFETLGDIAGRTILDIGCGSGPYVVEALKRGARHVTAVDPASNMLMLTRERISRAGGMDRCRLVAGLFPSVTLQPHDYAIVMGVMDYVADAEAFLAALRPLVVQAAAVSFPSKHWLRTPLRRVRYRLRRCPVYFYDEREIRRLASNAGFQHIDLTKISGAGMDFHACLKR